MLIDPLLPVSKQGRRIDRRIACSTDDVVVVRRDEGCGTAHIVNANATLVDANAVPRHVA